VGFTLQILEGPEQGKEYSFERIQITIGRTMENDVVLPDPGISRKHLRIRDKGGAYIISDLGSSNGTKVNGVKIQEEVLKSGDEILAGGAKIRFQTNAGGGTAKAKSKPAAARSRRGGGAARAPSNRGRPAARRGRAAAANRRGRRGRPAAGGAGGAKAGAAAGAAGGAGGGVRIQSAGMRRKQAEEKAAKAAAGEAAAAGKKGKAAKGAEDGKQSPIRRVKGWISGLDKKKKIMLGVGVGLVVVLLAAGLFKGGQQIVAGLRWYDEQMLTPGERAGNQPMTYGLGIANRQSRFRAAYQFKYANGRATVTYLVGGIDTKQEVEILLNGMHVEYAPLTLERWSKPITISLPRKHLLEHQVNKLEFINTVNRSKPEANEEWAVAVIEIQEQPLPPPDATKAQEAFANAKERYRNKGVSPGNLYKALQYFKEARDFLELMPEESRSEIYFEANDMIEKIEEEINKIFRARMFKAEQAFKYGKKEEAKEIFRILMLTIPNQDDPRHQRAREAYVNLGGSLQEVQ
jgi:hypothetical protein